MSRTSEQELRELAGARIREILQRPVIAEVINLLEGNLPSHLFFHSVAHTRDVLAEAVLFAMHDQLSLREIDLLATAAAYHDAGYLNCLDGHEGESAKMASQAMMLHGGYTPDEIIIVRTMILDTQVQQTPVGLGRSPRSELSNYLLDADLSNFGRSDFFERLEDYERESNADRLTLLKHTLQLMKCHEWLTPAARALREERKAHNIKELDRLIKAESLS